MIEPTIRDVLSDALDAYDRLTSLGEDVEDEWTYVTDLSQAWRDRLEALDASCGDDPAGPFAAATARLIDEVDRITDRHRAIDWLSTFPQVLIAAVEVRR